MSQDVTPHNGVDRFLQRLCDISATIGADVLMLGSSHRTKLVNLLKGNVITEVAKNLPENIQLVIHS